MRRRGHDGVGVIGVGYVGLVTAVCFADLGFDVVCRDIDAGRVDMLRRGDVPIYEPRVGQLLERNRDRLRFTLDMAELFERCRIVFVCVDTPSLHSGDADLSRVQHVLSELPALDDRFLVVMKSTVPVGTGEKVRAELQARGLGNVGYVSNPEFLREGRAVSDFLEPDRIVIGAFDAADAEAVASLYGDIRAPVVRTDVASAEMIKYASNCFLATKISFINEIANVCEEVGADVSVVAQGMGLDDRIGGHFLRPGIGYGGSCLAGEETVLARVEGHPRLLALEQLFAAYAGGESGDACIGAPAGLEVLAWHPGAARPQYLPVAALTRRRVRGQAVEVVTETGHRLRCTPDHPFLVLDGDGRGAGVKPAAALTPDDLLPLLLDAPAGDGAAPDELDVLAGIEAAGLRERDLVLTPAGGGPDAPLAGGDRGGALAVLERRHGAAASEEAGLPPTLALDEAFWRVIGLHVARGRIGRGARISWQFRARGEERLVGEVVAYWAGRGVRTAVRRTPGAVVVEIGSRLLAGLLTGIVGLGRGGLEQRLPDLAWTQPRASRRALLSGLWQGGGSWSGEGAVREYVAAGRELADGLLRLLGSLGVMARLELVPGANGYRISACPRRPGAGVAAVRVARVTPQPWSGDVYSLEVPGAGTFASTGGLVVHNCFPKDVRALKQLAGNSGYHFQLLTAVIEVNELQKRRVVGKLKAHLGSLRGRRIALLGLAFKADTDDMREATSLVLSGRLIAEGATVVAYDPVAMAQARRLLGDGVELAGSLLEAVTGADAAVIVTEWGEFRTLASRAVRQAMATPLIVDGRNLLDPRQAGAAGFVYESVGRPAHDPAVPSGAAAAR